MSGRSTISLRYRFDRHVARGADAAGCWLWRGAANNKGYGRFSVGGRQRLAHRVAFELVNPPIAEGVVVRHRCDTPRCVNPAHLELGTMRDNTADMVARGRARFGMAQGVAHPFHVLTDASVALMRHLRECGVKLKHLAALFGVSEARVSMIAKRRAWKHVPDLVASEVAS